MGRVFQHTQPPLYSLEPQKIFVNPGAIARFSVRFLVQALAKLFCKSSVGVLQERDILRSEASHGA